MIKKVLSKIKALEQKRKAKLDDLTITQAEIDDIDLKLKKLYTFKRDYEKLEKNSQNYLEELKGGKSEQAGPGIN